MIALVVIPILYAVYLLVGFLFLDELIYSGTKLTGALTDRTLPLDCKMWWLDHGDFKTEAWFLPLENCTEPAPIFIFAHPLDTVAEHWLSDARWLKSFGFHVLLVEYPGYADSGGIPNEKTIRRCMELAYDKAYEYPLVDKSRIVAIGQSLGANAACLLSETRNVASVIMHSGFPHFADLLRKYLLPSFLIKDKYNVMPVLSKYPGPTLFVQAVADKIVHLKYARRLAKAAIDPEVLFVEGGHYIQMTLSQDLGDRTRQFLLRNNLLQSSTEIESYESVTNK